MQPGKSATTVVLDLLRWGIIIIATGYASLALWRWHWLAAVLGLIPTYIVMLNVFGFLTMPLYLLTPETRRVRAMGKTLPHSKPD